MSNAATVTPSESVVGRLTLVEGRQFVGVVVQFAALVFLTRSLHIISPAFGNLVVLSLGGFVVHALLPLRYRLGFFLALSLAGIGLVLGVKPLGWLLLLGLPLIGICYLPIKFAYRLGLIAATILALVGLRAGALPTGVPDAVWPVLGSMFMIRLAIFLYDLSHAPNPPTVLRSLSYFFLLPNVCMPLFPAVDYKAFERTYFDTESYRIYQRGLHWMARGLLQIVVYRLVYHHFTLETTEVRNAGQLVQYVLTSFMLYLRLSGTFHFAIGLLHLFGFHLPESNHLYWLSSGFTDLFRRNNIYWRDAVIKLVYYPTVFRLKGRTPVVVTTVSLALVFLATWAGHSWLWFWLRGAPLLTIQDFGFYLFLGTLITYQAVRDLHKPRTKVAVPLWSFKRGLSVCATMGTLCVMWSFWSAGSVAEWLTIWDAATVWNLKSVVIIGGAIAVGLAFGGARFGVMQQVRTTPAMLAQETRRSLLITLGTIASLAVLANPSVTSFAGQTKRDFFTTLRDNQLNRKDSNSLLQGYYEQLDLGASQTNELAEADAQRRKERVADFEVSSLWHKAPTPLMGALAPNVDTLWLGHRFATNEHGLRDGPYSLVKPPRTLRIGVVGPSDVMGSGVANDETFENVLERHLNAANASAKYDKIEVLNFGVARTGMWQRAWLLDSKVPPFDCDLVLFVFHPGPDRGTGLLTLERALRTGIDPVLPGIRAFVDSIHFTASENSAANLKALAPYRDQFVDLSMRVVADVAREKKLPVVMLFLSQPTEKEPGGPEGEALAHAVGLPVINMMDFEGKDETELAVSQWDKHPSVLGHAYLADRLFRELGRAGYLETWGVQAAPAAPPAR